MKLSIEVEIQPEEIPLATELLKFLRSLTQQFGVSAPVVKNAKTLLTGIVAKLADPSYLDQAALDIHSILRNTSLGTRESIFDELVKVFLEVAFNQEHIFKGGSVVPYLRLIPKLEESYRQRMRDKVISTIMQVLVLKRPVGARREEFFLYAEAFAGMVLLEYISFDGAATLIGKLLNNPDNRAAGLTVLGKTTELCCPQLISQCEGESLDQLRKAVQAITHKNFKFDIAYICSRMHWSHPLLTTNGKAEQDMLQPPPPPMPQQTLDPSHTHSASLDQNLMPGLSLSTPPTSLTPVTSWQGHKDQIYAMCHDPLTKKLVTGGKEGVCVVWSEEGRMEQKVPMPDHYICALDMHPRRRLLFAVGVCSDKGKREPPCIALFSQDKSWQRMGLITRPGNSLISCVRAVFNSGSDGFATGEEVSSSPQMEERVCYYDLASASDLSDIQPEVHFSGHGDLVTCVTSTPLHPMMLFSGSRDQGIRIWDRRTGNSAGILGAEVMGKIVAHDQMVTWVDVGGTDLVSSGGDGCVAHWDLRKISNAATGCPPLQRVKIGGQPEMLLKVAAYGAPRSGLVAVAELGSLHLVDLNNPTDNIFPALKFPDGQGRRYFDLKWSDDLLYASSEKTVDVYQLC
ncbi:hypothetical protein BSKO_10889 [Bryopsis sp. KO-2023]|nr:hypothetical protein BSKO_10889 [Bryopsis sp. KO-2023]